jgi:hypothetical protein
MLCLNARYLSVEIDNLMKTIQNLNMYIYHDIPFTVGLTLKYNMYTMGYRSKRKVIYRRTHIKI